MGVGIVPILQTRIKGVDSFSIEGKAVASSYEEIEEIAEELDCKGIIAFSDAMIDDEIEVWYEASDALKELTVIFNYLKEKSNIIELQEEILEEMNAYLLILKEAQINNVKFYFTMLT